MKTYENDSLGYRISCGKLVSKLIKSDNKQNIIEENKNRFKGVLKHTIVSILGIAYQKTGGDFYLTEIYKYMKPFICTSLRHQCKVPDYVHEDEIYSIALTGIFDGINKYDKKKGFMYNSILNGIKRELFNFGYAERKHNIANSIELAENFGDVVFEKSMIRKEFLISLQNVLDEPEYNLLYSFISGNKINKYQKNRLKNIISTKKLELSWLTA